MYLSAIILTYNEEGNLPACLESMKALDCEIFVVDSGSTDRTVEIARIGGARVVQHPFDNYAAQRKWAQRNLRIKSDWVLHMDAAERLTPELVIEINKLPQQPPEGIDGFLLCKRIIFMGRWMKYGGYYPSYHLRLFHKRKGFCEDRLYDQHFLVNGKIRSLKHDYIDVITSDLSTWTLRHTRWAELEAREIMGTGNRGQYVRPALLGNPIERRRWLRENLYGRCPLFVRAFFFWCYRYFVRLGFLDGVEGLIYYVLQGFWYRFYVDAKVFEASKARQR